MRMLLMFALGLMLLSVPIGSSESYTAPTAYLEPYQSFSTAYIEHDPIVITSNADFESQPWDGNGTEVNPYIIEGLNITHSSTGISISNTDVYFEIRNCFISGPNTTSSNGIWLDNIRYGSVRNNIIELHRYGVNLGYSSDCSLAHNIAYNNSYSGFRIRYSDSCTIMNNSATKNLHYGFDIDETSTSTIINNTATSNNIMGFSGNRVYYSTITNNIATSNGGYGMRFDTTSNSSFSHNIAFANPSGFDFHHGYNITITNNTSNNDYVGFHFYYSRECIMVDNIMHGDGVSFSGSSISHYLHDVSGNTVNDKPLGYFKSVNDLVIEASQYGQVILANCSGVTVQNGLIFNVTSTIFLGFSTNCILLNNTAINAGLGFYLRYSSYCTLVNNTASNSSYGGFEIYQCSNIDLYNNTVSNAEYVGLTVALSPNCTLEKNTAVNIGYEGFVIWGSSTSGLINNIAVSSGYGFRIGDYTYCNLTGNTAIDCEYGFYVTSSHNCFLDYNVADGSVKHGFYVTESHSCNLTNNVALINGLSGFYLRGSSGCMLTNNTAANSGDYGFHLYQSPHCIIKNNTALDNPLRGFYVSSSSNTSLIDNTVMDSFIEISLHESPGCTLTNNALQKRGLFIEGELVSHWLHDISDNTVNGKPLGYFKSTSDLTIEGDLYGQVILVNCSGITVQNGVFLDTITGITLAFSLECILKNNLVSNNGYYGLYLWNSPNSTLIGNSAISNSYDGIYLHHSPNSTLVDNVATGNARSGFFFYYSPNGTLTSNVAGVNDLQGFYLEHSLGSTLSSNTAVDNGYCGFCLTFSSDCILVDNTAMDNGKSGFLLNQSSSSELTLNEAINNSEHGFYLLKSVGCTLMHNSAEENEEHGYYLSESSDCLIVENTASHNSLDGFRLISSHRSNLSSNTASSNSNHGIHLDTTSNCVVVGNSLDGGGLRIRGGWNLSMWIHTMSDNMVNGKAIGYFESVSSFTLDGSQFGQVILVNCTSVTISNGTFIDVDGIQLGFCDNCSLIGNVATGSEYGFYLYECVSCKLLGNEVTTSSYGFFLDNCDDCVLTNNVAHEIASIGFNLISSIHSTLVNNTASCSYHGIRLSHSDDFVLTENFVFGNDVGVLLSGCERALVYLNNFSYNRNNGHDDGGFFNSWDNGTHGNYWDDYDGVGDYVVSGTSGSRDRYPMVKPGYPPTIDHPEDIEYEFGTTGHSITWSPWHTHPHSYLLYRNHMYITEGNWNGTAITISIDGLYLGVYNYTLFVFDIRGNSASNSVFVTVVDTTPPIIHHPGDIEYEFGSTGYSIIWDAYDLAPRNYTIYRNGTPVASGMWCGDNISIIVDGLEPGVYNYTLVVFDSSGNMASNTVFVTVTPADTPPPTTDTTPTETPTTTPAEPQDMDLLMLITILGAIGGAALIVVFVILRRQVKNS